MEKNPPTLALQTDLPNEELRQLEWQGRQITRVLMALRVTSRILAFTISFGSAFYTLLIIESPLQVLRQTLFINIIPLRTKPIMDNPLGQQTRCCGRRSWHWLSRLFSSFSPDLF